MLAGPDVELYRRLKEEFPSEAEKIAAETGIPPTERLTACAGIQMIRELLIHGSCMLSEKELSGEEPVHRTEEPDNPEGLSLSSLFRR